MAGDPAISASAGSLEAEWLTHRSYVSPDTPPLLAFAADLARLVPDHHEWALAWVDADLGLQAMHPSWPPSPVRRR